MNREARTESPVDSVRISEPKYVPGRTNTSSPASAASTAAWGVGKSVGTTMRVERGRRLVVRAPERQR